MATTDNMPEDGVVCMVDQLLDRAVSAGASDLHFEPTSVGLRIRFRVDGVLLDVDTLPESLASNIIARLKVLASLLTYRVDVPQEGAFTIRSNAARTADPLDARVAVFPTVRGERAVVRLLHTVGQVNGLDELGLADEAVAELRRAARQPNGLILVTGPAGAGKSTTLYALARHCLRTVAGRSVISLEDPVEQRIDGLTQIQVQPFGELDYVRVMRSLLRQDVEVLLVGEIRDSQTAHVVVEASLTGHLVMSTMHSGDPGEAIARLLEMGIAPYQLVSAVTTVCAQRLLRTVCRRCGGTGCMACAETGCCGRTACGQLATMNEDVRRAVLARAPVAELRRVIARSHADLFCDARRLVDEGLVTEDEIQRVLGEHVGAPLGGPGGGADHALVRL